MGNRKRDRVIYIRTDEKLQAEFEKQKEASGYGSNADFVDYLLRINEGKQMDGVTLKDVRNYCQSFRRNSKYRESISTR